HEVVDVPLDSLTFPGLVGTDVVVVDATQDLRGATAACRTASVQEVAVPILVVVAEAALAALKPGWGFDDWVLPTASPAELETRLRLVGTASEHREGPVRGSQIGDLV